MKQSYTVQWKRNNKLSFSHKNLDPVEKDLIKAKTWFILILFDLIDVNLE